ncbi:hypothetical protein HDV01_006630 [Terramyces sp. JEL0728]|nr:hypothetical protein HDV01_006630 [Terramyces sp. JEL0728]
MEKVYSHTNANTPTRRVLLCISNNIETAYVISQWALQNVLKQSDSITLLNARSSSEFSMISKKLPPGEYEALPLCTILGEEKRAQIEMLIEIGKVFQGMDMHVDAIAVTGDARAEIERVVDNDKPDLVIIGTRGLGVVSRVLLGSVSEHIIHHYLGFSDTASFEYALPCLKILDLTGNQLVSFNTNLYPKLECLLIARNELQSIELKQLALLNISFNKIKTLIQVHVDHLIANNNQITSVEIINCKYLDISFNEIDYLDLSRAELEYVDLTGLPLKSFRLHPNTRYTSDMIKSNSQETLNEINDAANEKFDLEQIKRTIHPHIFNFFCFRNEFGQYESGIHELYPYMTLDLVEFVETCLINRILSAKQTKEKIAVIEKSIRDLREFGFDLQQARQLLDLYFLDLEGIKRSGKSSIQNVVFNKMQANETLYLEQTLKIHKIFISSFIDFQVWDCPDQTEVDFFTANSLVYIVDAQDDYIESLHKLIPILLNAYSQNPKISFEIFIHKVDGLSDDDKIDIQRDVFQRINDELIDNEKQINLSFHQTSIYDHSIFEAFSKIVQKLIMELPALENLLNMFCSNSGIEKAFIFDLNSKIYIATDSSPGNFV